MSRSALALLLLSLSPPASAYQLPWNSVNSGGRPGVLTGYALNASVGQTVQGTGTSVAYDGSWGFWPGVWSFTTGTVDAGVTEILEPSGVVDTLSETPRVTVHNYGTLMRSFDVWFEIRDSATPTLYYSQFATVTDLEGGQDCYVTFPEWDVPNRDGRYYCRSWTELAGDLDRSNDTAESHFAVEADAQQPPNWTQRPNVPTDWFHRDVRDGAAAATDPQGFYEYLLKGNSTCEFYRYDPAVTSWFELDPIPERGRDHKERPVKAGGTLAQVGGKFYATKGGCLEFWEYDPVAQSGHRWTQKADVPDGDKDVAAGASAAGVTIGPASYVYLLKASGTCEFYRYDVANDHWQEMARAPGERREEFKIGSSISSDGTDTIFALKGILNSFYAYVVSTNTWLDRPDLPLGSRKKQAKGGAAICYHLRSVYCIKGSNSQEFWIYNCNGDSWTQGSDVPLGSGRDKVQDGGTLVYCRASRYLFCTKGASLEFWSYGLLSNIIGPQSPEQVMAVEGYGTITYGLTAASALVPGRDRVRFALPAPGHVNLRLYDMTGRVVRVLVNGWQPAGRHEISLRADDLAQGVYLLRYAAGDYIESRKLIVQR